MNPYLLSLQHWQVDSLPLGLPGGSAGEKSACNAGDLGSIPGLGRSPGEGNSYPLQYSGLQNSVDCIVHGVAKSWTRLSDCHLESTQMSFLSCSSGGEMSEMAFTGLKPKCLQDSVPSRGWGRASVSLPFPAPRSCSHSQLMTPYHSAFCFSPFFSSDLLALLLDD